MHSMPFSRIFRRAFATAAALAMFAAPAAFAMVPDKDLAVREAQLQATAARQQLDPQLVPSKPAPQQPADPPSWPTHPQTLTPVQASSSDNSWSPDGWLIALMAGGAVVLAGGAFLVVSRRSPVRSRASV